MLMLAPALAEGARLFNAGKFFEAHEAWEDHWGVGSREERELTMGLLKVAVALHHLVNGNVRGFDRQLEMGLPRLRAGAAALPAWDLAAFLEEVESLHASVRFHGIGPALPALPRLPEPPGAE